MSENTLKEAVLRDPDMGESEWKEMTAKALDNPLYQLVMREAVYKDVAQALGAVRKNIFGAETRFSHLLRLLEILSTVRKGNDALHARFNRPTFTTPRKA
jgi:hypothetical protein